jgi:hypothetical protein
MSAPIGCYEGRLLVRAGRESELSRKELSNIKKSKDVISLDLRANGSFLWKKTFEGAYKVSGDTLTFKPERFSGLTLEEMRRRSEEMGRAFNLAFIFDPFKLVLAGEALVTLDDGAAMYTEYRRVGS